MKSQMIKKFFLATLVMAVCFGVSGVTLAKDNYLYRKRANWVKLDKLSNKQLAGQKLNHPYTDISVEQMTAMLMSLNMNKGQAFKKGIKTSDIFSEVEAHKYAPLIVKALSEADPNQVVNLAIVHRRPYFILRNDYISIINIFVTDDGVHVNFGKLFAKLDGDYQQASLIDKSINDAKSIRVSLAPAAGQVLLPDVDELVLDLHYDFTSNVKMTGETNIEGDDSSVATTKVADKKNKSVKTSKEAGEVKTTPELTPASSNQDVASRLKTLEDLKKSKLISDAEYQKKRQEILSGL